MFSFEMVASKNIFQHVDHIREARCRSGFSIGELDSGPSGAGSCSLGRYATPIGPLSPLRWGSLTNFGGATSDGLLSYHLNAMVTLHISTVLPNLHPCAQQRTRRVAVMDSCFVLFRTHQHGIARRKGLI